MENKNKIPCEECICIPICLQKYDPTKPTSIVSLTSNCNVLCIYLYNKTFGYGHDPNYNIFEKINHFNKFINGIKNNESM